MEGSEVLRAEAERLRRDIERHNQLYYVKAKPELSDYDFDLLLERLVQLEREHPELLTPDSPTQRVGGTVTKEFPSVEHREPMLSLANTYSIGEVEEFVGRLNRLLEAEGARGATWWRSSSSMVLPLACFTAMACLYGVLRGATGVGATTLP